jgi:hypothetical protein
MIKVWTDAAEAKLVESATKLNIRLREEFWLGSKRRNFRNAAGSSPRSNHSNFCLQVDTFCYLLVYRNP